MRRHSSTRRLFKFNSRPLSLNRLEDRLVPAGLMLPNLQVYQPDMPNGTPSANVTVNANHEIRFTTGLANLGTGPFDLRAIGNIVFNPDGTQSRVTYQRLYNDSNNNGYYDAGDDQTYTDTQAGTFTYHPTHGHMHFDDFAIARLRVRPPGDSLGPVVAVGPKTSFCLLDITRTYSNLPGCPTTGQYSCDATHEGISIGWRDIYSSGLDGQFINVTNIPNGDYWLEIECDPLNHIQELDETDNISRSKITITNQPATGFMILSSTPLGAQTTSVNHVDFNFNQPIDTTTFTSAAVTLTGPPGQTNIPISSIQVLSSVQVRVNFATQNALGTYQMNVDPTLIRSATGGGLDQNNNGTGGEAGDIYTHIFSITAPYIQGITPTGTTAAPVTKVTLNYDRPMVSSSITPASIVAFSGPGAVNLLGSITSVTPVTPGGQSRSFDVNFTSLSAGGTYSITIGSHVQDPLGLYVDQNHNSIPDETADQYTSTFTIPIAGTYGPDTFGYSAIATTYQTYSMVGATGISYTNTDDESKPLDIGTDKFNFYGTTYTGNASIYAATNGLVSFGGGSNDYNNDNGMPSIGLPLIAPLWDDWIIGSGNPQVQYLKRDTNNDGIYDQLVIEWNQIRHYQTTTGGMTFEAILELNTGNRPGKIIFNYPDLVQGDVGYDNGAAATVGLRSNSTLNSTLVVSNDSNSHPLVQSSKAMLLSVPSVTSITRTDATPADDGLVHYQVTFSEGVTGVLPTDFSVTTTGNISMANVVGAVATGDPKVWNIVVDSGEGSGTLRVNLVDHDTITSLPGAKLGGVGLLNGDYSTSEVYTIVQRAPQVFHVAFGDDSAQRSRVYEIRVTFDHGVEIPNLGTAFQVTGPNGPVTLLVDTGLSDPEATVARIQFAAGPGTEYGSLKDGNYTLTVFANQVSTGGVALDGNGDDTGGDDFSTQFHRLFGDFDGSRRVDLTDMVAFRTAMNSGPSIAFDFNGDQQVDQKDFMQFRSRFNVTI